MNRWGKLVLSVAVVLGVAGLVFLIVVLVGKGPVQAGVWAGVLAAMAGIVAAVAAIWPLVARQSKMLPPPEIPVPEWLVSRPTEATEVVDALLRRRGQTVGITTALQGAGGFGKTTLALMVCGDRRVRRRFKGFVYLVTIGRDVQDATAIARKVNDVIKLVAGEDATFTDPDLAGQRLGSLLDTRPRRLLVLDDVWNPEQLAPFAQGGRRCVRLITTRIPGLLPGHCIHVRVDQMSPEQAQRLLTSGLPLLAPSLTEGLLAVTGRWPLLLRLVNKILINAARTTADLPEVGTQLLKQLQAAGPAVVDEILGEPSGSLEVGGPRARARAVRATIGASTSLLDPQDVLRFRELGVFAEDETIPFGLVARLWSATAGLTDLQSSQLCARLAELALVSAPDTGPGGITLHDVVGDFLRSELGSQPLTQLHQVLLDAVAADLPSVAPLNATQANPMVAWWELGHSEQYLWDHLIEHLIRAGRSASAEAMASDLRWVGARLQEFGPAAPSSDLSLVGTPRTVRLQALLARSAHLLTPCEPPEAVVDILYSRAADDPEWAVQVSALQETLRRPRLVNRCPLPDVLVSARRVLTDVGAVAAVAVGPDGSWFATARSGKVQIWDPSTGQERAAYEQEPWSWQAIAVTPDGSWLAGGESDRVRIWGTGTWRERASLTLGHGRGAVGAVAIGPDGSWAVSAVQTGKVRIWDVAAGRVRTTLRRYGCASGVAVAPDAKWLAYAHYGGAIRVWDTIRRRTRVTLKGHRGSVRAIAAAPDGSWLVSGGYDRTVRIWDAATGQLRATLQGHRGSVNAVAVAPDGSWLVSGGEGKTVRIWDAATGRRRATLRPLLTREISRVVEVAIAPDGSWLASSGKAGSVLIWDVASGKARAELMSYAQYRSEIWRPIAIAPDGKWLAVGYDNGTVHIWEVVRRTIGIARTVLEGHTGQVRAVAVAPDGMWLASGGEDGVVRIWDTAAGQARALMRIDSTVLTCAWLGTRGIAVGGPAGLYIFDFHADSASLSTMREET